MYKQTNKQTFCLFKSFFPLFRNHSYILVILISAYLGYSIIFFFTSPEYFQFGYSSLRTPGAIRHKSYTPLSQHHTTTVHVKRIAVFFVGFYWLKPDWQKYKTKQKTSVDIQIMVSVGYVNITSAIKSSSVTLFTLWESWSDCRRNNGVQHKWNHMTQPWVSDKPEQPDTLDYSSDYNIIIWFRHNTYWVL